MANQKSTSSTTRNVADSAHETVEDIAAKTEQAEARIRRAADDAEQRVRSAAATASEGTGEYADDLRGRIEKHPFAAIGIAFLVGYIIARLFRR